MPQSINVEQKRRGRPATGTDPLIGVRLPPDMIKALDAWAKAQGLTRSAALRTMIEQALAAEPKVKGKR
jgi:Ribbon-helix-helix protein, copG family